MPINCPTLSRFSQKEFAELDYCVMRHAFDCHNQLGRLCDESIYQNDFAARLDSAGIPVWREARLAVTHRDFVKSYRLDLIVANAWIYELKTDSMLMEEHEAQLLNYLFLCDCHHGKLPQVEGRFVNTTITPGERRRFDIETERWKEPTERDRFLRETVLDLLRDWGGWLELALYQKAVCHFLGGESQTLKPVTLARDGVILGNQPLHLLTPDTV
jgi:GxxExxY protein